VEVVEVEVVQRATMAVTPALAPLLSKAVVVVLLMHTDLVMRVAMVEVANMGQQAARQLPKKLLLARPFMEPQVVQGHMVLGMVEVVAVQALWVNLAHQQIAAMEARDSKVALQVHVSTMVPEEVVAPTIPSASETLAQVVWEVVVLVDHMDPRTLRTTNLVVPAQTALVVVAVAIY